MLQYFCGIMASYLVSDHHVGDLGFAVDILVLLLVGENREDKVARFALALSNQKATNLAFFCEEFLSVST